MKIKTFSCVILFLVLLFSSGGAWALGEVIDGYPMWRELLQLVLTNRVRQDTRKAKDDYNNPGSPKNKTWSTKDYSPCPPMLYHHAVSKAARGHSEDMAQHQYFSHEGRDGSRPGDRIRRYFSAFSAAGENIARGTRMDAQGATIGWLNSDGHRENIFKCSWTHMGIGFASGAKGNYWTQNFVLIRGTRLPLVTTGIHFPERVRPGESVRFYANYHDMAGAAPKEAYVVVNGRCYSMQLEYGSINNGNYHTKAKFPAGCQPYYFRFRSSSGVLSLYPSHGSYHVSAGDTCNAFYSPGQKEADCDQGCNKVEDCASHQECIQGKCVDTGRCSDNTDCPGDHFCKEKKCKLLGKLGQTCDNNKECSSSLLCISVREKKLCTRECSLSKTCPQGFACQLGEGNKDYCGPPGKCETDAECATYQKCEKGACTNREKCSQHSDCSLGAMCKGSICVQLGTLGLPCEGQGDCNEGMSCIPWKVEGKKKPLCGTSCNGPTDCPTGFTCDDFDKGRSFCFGTQPKPKPKTKKTKDKDPEPGCGCATPAADNNPPTSLLLLSLLLLLGWRRR